MSYIDQQKTLRAATEKLSPQVLAILPDTDIEFLIEEICGTFTLTMGEVGEICELVRQIITKEQPAEGFSERLKEKLNEDNQPKTEDVVSALSEKIFSKLLPALGIKVPLEMAIKPKAPTTQSPVAQTAPVAAAKSAEPPPVIPKVPPAEAPIPKPRVPEPPRSVSFRRLPPLQNPTTAPLRPPMRTPPFQQTYQEPVKTGVDVPTQQVKPKPPIIETSHEKMSDQPLESLMKMLEGVVTEKALARQFEKLPYSLKNALRSVDSAKKVVDIGRKYAIHVDKLGDLGAETGMVLLGFSHPGQFLNRLSRHLDLPEEKIRAIAQEINTEIFLKVREALKEMNGEGVKMQPPIPQPPEAPTPLPKIPAQKLTVNPMPETSQGGIQMNPEFEATLTREEILQGIEHPTPAQFEPEAEKAEEPESSQKSTGADIIVPPPITALEPTVSLKPDFIPPAPLPADDKEKEIPIPPQTNAPATPPTPNIPKPAEPTTNEPAKPPKSIADQKLSGTVASSKTESRYSADPYREPAE